MTLSWIARGITLTYFLYFFCSTAAVYQLIYNFTTFIFKNSQPINPCNLTCYHFFDRSWSYPLLLLMNIKKGIIQNLDHCTDITTQVGTWKVLLFKLKAFQRTRNLSNLKTEMHFKSLSFFSLGFQDLIKVDLKLIFHFRIFKLFGNLPQALRNLVIL